MHDSLRIAVGTVSVPLTKGLMSSLSKQDRETDELLDAHSNVPHVWQPFCSAKGPTYVQPAGAGMHERAAHALEEADDATEDVAAIGTHRKHGKSDVSTQVAFCTAQKESPPLAHSVPGQIADGALL